MPQLWQGRASKAVDSRVNDFNSSIRFDARMIEQDIQGSLVHSAMLARPCQSCGIWFLHALFVVVSCFAGADARIGPHSV